MDLKKFKLKWKNEIQQGIVIISDNQNTIITDRWDGKDFLCDRPTINKIQNDLRRMNYFRFGMGTYVLSGENISLDSLNFIYKHLNKLNEISN